VPRDARLGNPDDGRQLANIQALRLKHPQNPQTGGVAQQPQESCRIHIYECILMDADVATQRPANQASSFGRWAVAKRAQEVTRSRVC
jgi:hypothetical protein